MNPFLHLQASRTRSAACVFLAFLGLYGITAWVEAQQPDSDRPFPCRLGTEHVPNVVQIHPNVMCGGLPEGEAGFAELQRLGIRTIISVDGARPDVAAAQKHGMRYVHLPHGYDGIPAPRGKELAKALLELPGPIYFHCHHGKHRSPAAAAVACITGGFVRPDRARKILATAGTSEQYRGLYRDVEAARPLPRATLAELPSEFPAMITPPPMVDAMVQIEHLHDRLKQLAANQWQPLAEHPDVDPAHEALLLREQFTELLRTDDLRARPVPFKQLTIASQSAAQELEQELERWRRSGDSKPPAALSTHLQTLTENCTRCHQKFRDGN